MSELSEYEKHLNAIDALKKPSMLLGFGKVDSSDTEAHTGSYKGGKPYITEKDKWPTCPQCSRQMDFLIQINEKQPNGDHLLKVFYYCDCLIKEYIPNIQLIEYRNPSEDELDLGKSGDGSNQSNNRYDLIYEPIWSVPNWLLLPFYDTDLYKDISTQYGQKAENYYNNLLLELELERWYFHFSMYGYPEYVSDPKLMKCHCCGEVAEFYFQLDSDAKLGFNFNDSTLFCFRCPRTNYYYFMLN